MATENALNQSINKAQKHYSSMFFLPSFKTALTAVATICLIAGLSSAVFDFSFEGVTFSLTLGVCLFAVNFFFDLLTSKYLLGDPIFVLRRTTVLSLAGWLIWLLFILIGVGVGLTVDFLWWIRLCLLGFAAMLTLRGVVLFAASSATSLRRLTACLLSPLACIVTFVLLWLRLDVSYMKFVPFIAISPLIAIAAALLLVSSLDRLGKNLYGISSMSIFQAFMLNWVTSANAPLEAFLEKLGKNENINASILKFDAPKPKAAFLIPLVHPGPFKNIGSSLLPSLLKQNFEQRYGGNACVPLGLLGHELDAASQQQNHKIINHILQHAAFEAQNDKATALVRASEDFVCASCQLFGKTALLSFTLAPKTTEDLPQELGDLVYKEAKNLGLEDVVIVNAHNSLTENVNIEATIQTLNHIASKALKKALAQKPTPFEVGSATVYPEEFTLKDGMGTGGITAITIKTGTQTASYIIIDGNNMVSGLREKILPELAALGFSESEIFTTDTHAVSAVVVGRRGYHPVGEAMNHQALIKYIKAAAQTAQANLEPCKSGSLTITIPDVQVIGSDSLSSLTVLVDKAIQKAKQLVVPIFGIEGLLLLLLLLFL
ncbi:MAG: DUF2070 family protein [Candidatus Bathyarchaeota archaeon]|nr:DUF2070 family protein [Candidatus Bathyarchaeota archaeon]